MSNKNNFVLEQVEKKINEELNPIYEVFRKKGEDLDKRMMEVAKSKCQAEYEIIESHGVIGKDFQELTAVEQEYYAKFQECFTKISFGLGDYNNKMFGTTMRNVKLITKNCIDDCIESNSKLKDVTEKFPFKECVRECKNKHISEFQDIYKNAISKLDEINEKF